MTYYVREVVMPFEVKGIVTPNADDDGFSIYINALLSDDQKRKALDHEIHHIEHDDFYNGKDIEDIEKSAEMTDTHFCRKRDIYTP